MNRKALQKMWALIADPGIKEGYLQQGHQMRVALLCASPVKPGLGNHNLKIMAWQERTYRDQLYSEWSSWHLSFGIPVLFIGGPSYNIQSR